MCHSVLNWQQLLTVQRTTRTTCNTQNPIPCFFFVTDMKTVSGVFLIAVALAAHLPQLHGAPSIDIQDLTFLDELIGKAKEERCPLPQQRRNPLLREGRGFVDTSCDFMRENPDLENVQTYKDQFEIELECRNPYSWGRSYCTTISLRSIDFSPAISGRVRICDYSSNSILGSSK